MIEKLSFSVNFVQIMGENVAKGAAIDHTMYT